MQATLSRTNSDLSLAAVMAEEGLGEEFPEIDTDDLLVRISRHWEEMIHRGVPVVSVRDVVLDYGSRFAGTENSRFHFSLRKRG